MNINNKNSSFSNSPIIVGDNNKVNINSTSKNIDWEALQDELIKALGKLPQNTKEYDMTKKALVYATTKDENGLIKFLKNNWTKFATDIFTGAASGVLVEVLKSLI